MLLISKYINLDKQERSLLLYTFIFSVKVRYFIKFHKMPYYVNHLGRKSVKTEKCNYNVEDVKKLIRNIKRVNKFSFWRTKCFEDAFTLKLLLKKQAVESTIYFGVKKNDNDTLDAHAWLKIGEDCLIGCAGIETYTVTEFFT